MTAAVRSYSAAAPQAEKEKKYGQQKWGLFETDYQRRKGITTEQSLQEIEQFCEGGGEVVVNVIINQRGVVLSALVVSGGD